MARFCGKCGTAANEKATFCNKCGNRLLQKKVIRYGHEDKSSASNPYRPDKADAAPSGPVGVMPPVARPGKKAPSETPPPIYTAPSAPTAGQSPYATSGANPFASSDASESPSRSGSSSLSRLDEAAPPFAALEEDTLARARATVRSFALWSAGIVLFPLPFSELIALIPVQTAMILSLSKIFNVQDPPEKILAYIAATSGVTVFGQVTMIIVANLVPFFGKLVTAPFIYGWTYGLGEVAIRYFQSQGQISGDEMKQVFKSASKQASKVYKEEKKVGKDESLQALRDHLAPEEYERLRHKFGNS